MVPRMPVTDSVLVERELARAVDGLLSVDHQFIKAEEHRRKGDEQHDTDDQYTALIRSQKDFTSRLADVRR